MSKTPDPATLAQVRQACRELHLPTVGARADSLAQQAIRGGRTHLGFLAAVLEAECEDRAERRRQRRIAEARFPRQKRLTDFRFEDAPTVSASLIAELATGGFIDRAENVILIGESGTG